MGSFCGSTSRLYGEELQREFMLMNVSINGVKKMWNENCLRMMKGYGPREPTTMEAQVFYMYYACVTGW